MSTDPTSSDSGTRSGFILGTRFGLRALSRIVGTGSALGRLGPACIAASGRAPGASI
jgi:hypothetical protein